MNQGLAMIDETAVTVAAWTLLHFFWQGALLAAALAAALRLLRQRSAHLRYAVACGVLAMMAAAPVATGLWLASHAQPPGVSVSHVRPAGAPSDVPAPPAPRPPAVAASTGATPPADAAPRFARLEPALPWLVGLWLAGVAALSCRHLGGWLRVRRLRRRGVRPADRRWRRSCRDLARRLGIRAPVELLASTRVAVPTVVGWLKPVVLFPASTFTGLDPRQLEAILAHELAHIRRHDYLVNLLQVALETLLFYHPAVWWASRQVRHLREHCCDDLAVAVCGDRMVYARALADLEELRFAAPVFALGADGGPLLERVRRLAGAPAAGGSQAPPWMTGTLAAVAIAATAAVLAFAGRPGVAQEQAAAAEPAEVAIRKVPLVSPAMIARVAEPVMIAQAAAEQGDAASRRDPGPSAGAASRGLPIPLDDLIEMKRYGLDHLLDEIEGTAYAGLPTRQLLEMARHGVDRELIAELDAAGYRDLQAAELIELARYGVDAELIAELRGAGYPAPAAAELVALAKYGVDAELIAELRESGFGTPPLAELVELSRYGVDGDYIREMKAAGHDPSLAELVEMSKFGVDGELVDQLSAAGLSDLAGAELVSLAKYGVDGDYIREMRSAGYQVTSTQGLVELSKFGVDAELIAELAALGYRDLDAEGLVRLAKYGVDGDFIRELRDAGYDGLSIEDLTRMARYGVDAEFLSKMSRRDPI